MNQKNNLWHGWVVLDKPLGMSSNYALQKLRSMFDRSKGGHGGTLDPLATGVLPIALGEATKLIPYIMDKKKGYRFTITWGEQRTTDDAEGEVIATSSHRPSAAEIEKIIPNFVGNIHQVPPFYSALKVAGKRAYDLARHNIPFELEARMVFVDSLKLIPIITDYQAQFEVICGKGTYIRSLARDMSIALGTVGYISALRRTGVGMFKSQDSLSFEKLLELKDKAELKEKVYSVDAVLDDIPVVTLTPKDLECLKQGQKILCDSLTPSVSTENLVRCKDFTGQLHALSKWQAGFLIPQRVFNINLKE